MHVDGVEAGAVERRRHLDLAVDALLAQDRDPRAARRVAMNGAATSSVGIEASAAADSPGSLGVDARGVLLVGAARVVAQRAACA